MRMTKIAAAAVAIPLCALSALAQQVTIDMNKISASGVGAKIGTVMATQGQQGVQLKVNVTQIPAGKHGFHLHEKGDCGPAMKVGKMAAGAAAGGHYDPAGTNAHKGPKGAGHKGDLPALNATAKGVDQTVVAPNLKLSELSGRALVIHAGGDTYSDKPKDGGGGARIACGQVPKIEQATK